MMRREYVDISNNAKELGEAASPADEDDRASHKFKHTRS